MQTKHWRQWELYDGTYTLRDLLDYHEMVLVEQENQRRMEKAAELMREMR